MKMFSDIFEVAETLAVFLRQSPMTFQWRSFLRFFFQYGTSYQEVLAMTPTLRIPKNAC